jgi:hypothetical protein
LRGDAGPWYPTAVDADPPPLPPPPRLRRAIELAYGVEGVVGARVWQWPGRVAVGVRGGANTSPTELLRRVESAVSALREPGETWDFGILEDAEDPPEPPQSRP